jgi:hypothetical protein
LFTDVRTCLQTFGQVHKYSYMFVHVHRGHRTSWRVPLTTTTMMGTMGRTRTRKDREEHNNNPDPAPVPTTASYCSQGGLVAMDEEDEDGDEDH